MVQKCKMNCDVFNLFDARFTLYLVFKSKKYFWLKFLLTLIILGGVGYLMFIEEYIFEIEKFQNVQIVSTSGVAVETKSHYVQWDQLDITNQGSDMSNIFVSTDMTIENQQILAFKDNKPCAKDADCGAIDICISSYCNSVHWAPLQKGINYTNTVGSNFLVWVKPMGYCKSLSQQRVNNIRQYPTADYNTYSFEQLMQLVGLVKITSGIFLIHAASIDTLGFMCADTVDLKFRENARKTVRIEYEYTLGTKNIIKRKVSKENGVVVQVLGTQVKKTIDISICIAVVVALYGLLRLVNDFVSWIAFTCGKNGKNLLAKSYGGDKELSDDGDQNSQSGAQNDDESDLLSMTF